MKTHKFHALAFVENFNLRELAAVFPEARTRPYELTIALEPEGDIFIFSFGAVVFHDVPGERRAAETERLHRARPGLKLDVVREDFTVEECSGGEAVLKGGVLRLDRMTRERAGVVALIVAQSAAMEYYERIVQHLFTRTGELVGQLETRGTVPLRTRPLHRFMGEAISTRTEVLAVLHLLDKPDAMWDDPMMDRIYADLRAEFDLADRYAALELKLRSVQEALELVLDIARDRRLFLLEAAVVLLIIGELAFSLLRHR